MFSLGKQKIEVACGCGRKHTATFQDAINGRVIRCSCGEGIQLKDGNGSVRKGISDIDKAFKDLDDAFKKFGR